MLPILLKQTGLLALCCGLLACGEPKSSSASSTAQAASISSKPRSLEASAQPQSQSSKSVSKAPDAETIYTELDRLIQQPCQKQEKTVGNVRYSLCSTTDEKGIIRVVSAASSHATAGDGAGYWLNEQGGIYAIRYFHSGETLILLEDEKTVVELVGNREIKIISDKARWMGLELGARDTIMTISEQFDSSAPTP